jgi:hypothetical protein
LHVLNWGSPRALLPEVSGARWSDIFLDFNHPPYGLTV